MDAALLGSPWVPATVNSSGVPVSVPLPTGWVTPPMPLRVSSIRSGAIEVIAETGADCEAVPVPVRATVNDPAVALFGIVRLPDDEPVADGEYTTEIEQVAEGATVLPEQVLLDAENPGGNCNVPTVRLASPVFVTVKAKGALEVPTC